MKWVRADNPHVWEATDGRHFAVAESCPHYQEGGYNGRVFARPVQMSFVDTRPEKVGMSFWGATPDEALRMTIEWFDQEAELPEVPDG